MIMRIISGKLKGNILNIPKNKKTRPLKDSARENIFNLLTHSNKVTFQFEKSKILDLYSGTGSFGLECLSRGAKNVYFIEKDKDAIKILEKNIEKLNIKNKVKIFSDDVFNLINKADYFKQKFNLIFQKDSYSTTVEPIQTACLIVYLNEAVCPKGKTQRCKEFSFVKLFLTIDS